MLGEEPFPDESGAQEAGGTSEPMLRKEAWQRFGDTGVYRDVPFAVLFVLQLLSVLAVAISNGIGVSGDDLGGSGDMKSVHGVRARQLLLILGVTALTASLLSGLWLVLLRSGARQIIWAGAAGGIALSLINGITLLVQVRGARAAPFAPAQSLPG